MKKTFPLKKELSILLLMTSFMSLSILQLSSHRFLKTFIDV